MYAHTRLTHLLLPDEAARDDLLLRFGLHAAVPSRCRSCRKPVPVDQSPEAHSVACCHGNGGNRAAGTIVEKAIFDGIQRLEPGATRSPHVLDHPHFTVKPGAQQHKKEADVRSHHLGVDVLIDTRLCSRVPTALSVCKEVGGAARGAERDKLREYSKGLAFPPACFIPMGLDSVGAWGPSMKRFFDEAFTQFRSNPSSDGRALHWVRVNVSLAVCKANQVYLRGVRYGRHNGRSVPQLSIAPSQPTTLLSNQDAAFPMPSQLPLEG